MMEGESRNSMTSARNTFSPFGVDARLCYSSGDSHYFFRKIILVMNRELNWVVLR
jgi:hypothetical protein